MQHIVEVAFDFNDKAITEYIENQLEKDVRDGVTSKAWKEFRDSVPHVTYDRDGDFMEYMADAVYKRFRDAHELSCGHTCYTSLPEPPAYCDECGARVVES